MAKAATRVYRTIKETGTQESCIEIMQTRDELYKTLDYWQQEQAIDKQKDE